MDELIEQVQELHERCTREPSDPANEGRMGLLMHNIEKHDGTTPPMKDFVEAVREYRKSKGYGTPAIATNRVIMEAAYNVFLQAIGDVAEEDDDSSPLFISTERDDS